MTTTTTTLPERPTSLAERIAQLLIVRIGSNLPPIVRADDDLQRIATLLEQCPVGGLLLFNGKQSIGDALQALQQLSAVPLLVASDIERGVGQQIEGGTVFPHATAFGRLGEDAESAVRGLAEATAYEARQAGIHMALAPVADVNTNPRNPIVAIRALSDDAGRAAELAATYIRAAESAGLLTTAKHFAGHGDTHQDSHDSLPIVASSADELRGCELVPFGAAIEAGVSAVMTAHVAFPCLDPSGAPATLSAPMLRTLLRQEMGFGGVVCSDSLLMAGVRDQFANEGEMARAALGAGVDLLLDLHDPVGVVRYLGECVDAGTLEPRRVDEAFERVWALKQRAFRPRPKRQGEPPAAEWAHRVAREAVEVHDHRPSPLPLDPSRPLVAVLMKPFELASDPPEQALATALRQRFQDVQYLELGPRASAAELDRAEHAARSAEQLLIAMIIKPAAWHAFGLLPSQEAWVGRLCAMRDTVLVSLGVPYTLARDLPATVRVCSYSDVGVSQQAVVERLLEPC